MATHFTDANTEGFELEDLPELNAAVERLIQDTGMEVGNACDLINNAWRDHGDSADTLYNRARDAMQSR